MADWLGKPFLGGLGLGDGIIALLLAVLIAGFVAYLTFSHSDRPDSGMATEAAVDGS